MAKEMYDYAEDFPSYMYIYETVCDICKQQCSIIDEGADLLLSSVFCALLLLKEVSLYFCETLAFDHGPLNRDARKDEPYQYHLEAVTNAIHNARRRGVAIHSIGLYALDFPDIHTGEEPSMAIVLKSLRRLLKDMIVLRLRGRECIFKLLSHGALGIHQLEMCGMQVADTTLKDFLQANEETVRSISFHKVGIYAANSQPRSSHLTTSSTLCSMLGVPASTSYRKDDCACLPWWKERSRLVIGILTDDRPQLSGTLAKRKLDEL